MHVGGGLDEHHRGVTGSESEFVRVGKLKTS